MDIVQKVEKKLAGWKGKLLAPCGRLILIKHVLQCVPLHILAEPPKTIISRIESIIANFFWGTSEEGSKYHWVKWMSCFPMNEGGLGIICG